MTDRDRRFEALRSAIDRLAGELGVDAEWLGRSLWLRGPDGRRTALLDEPTLRAVPAGEPEQRALSVLARVAPRVREDASLALG